MFAPNLKPTPGTCYKFTVANAHEAASVIRERLGEHARVLSVKTIEPSGLRGLWASPKLEIIASLDLPEPAPAPAPEPAPVPQLLATSDEEAAPVAVARVSTMLRASRSGSRLELASLLRRSGFSEAIMSRVEGSPVWTSLQEMPLHRALVETGRYLRRVAGARKQSAPLSRAAFFGLAGSGRTTALCKWLAAEVSRRARTGHVITAEFDQPVSRGPLPVFCEAMGIPLAHYPASTQPALPGGFVYFDLPGLSLRDSAANAPLAAFLDQEQITERVLVLNAAYGHTALRAGYARGRELGATHVVFTHLDELAQWGGLWDLLLDGGLEPLFLATGSSLTGEYEEDVYDALTRRTLPASSGLVPASGDEPAEDAA